MTPKQIERIKNKVKKIKKELAADKRFWGGHYHDGRGLRYLPPELYLQINDYSGALRYFNWFDKNFPEDTAHGVFYFEWVITLFKRKKIERAQYKVLETFFANMFVIDYFLEKEPLDFIKSEHSKWQYSILVKHFQYKKDQEELKDFGIWLEDFNKTELFLKFANRFVEIEVALVNQRVGKRRSQLVKEQYELLDKLKV